MSTVSRYLDYILKFLDVEGFEGHLFLWQNVSLLGMLNFVDLLIMGEKNGLEVTTLNIQYLSLWG
jgi:hypothetical protein